MNSTEEQPLPHRWVGPRGPVKWEHCEVCMTIRRKDDSNGPCLGEAAPIKLRTSNPPDEHTSGIASVEDCIAWLAQLRRVSGGLPVSTIAHIGRLTRELAEAQRALELDAGSRVVATEAAEAYKAERDRLREWLKKARHHAHCYALDRWEPDRGCTCGLDALRGEEGK